MIRYGNHGSDAASTPLPLRGVAAPPATDPPLISSPQHETKATHRQVDSLRLHFVRNVFAVIPIGAVEMAAATIRTVFAQPTADAVRTQLDTVADMLGRQFPKIREMLLEAKEDLTAFADFPAPALEEDPVHEPAGTAEQGNQTPHRRRPGLPQPGRRPSPRERGPRRNPQRMDRLPPPLPLQREHGHPLHRHPDRPARRIRQLIAYTTRRDVTLLRHHSR